MKRILPGALCIALGTAGLLSAHAQQTDAAKSSVAAPATTGALLSSGIDLQYVDPAARAQDDFYRHVNGLWLQKTEIPADKSRWGAFSELQENTLPQLRGIIDAASKDPAATKGSDTQKIGDMYASFMDQATRDRLGRAPLAGDFARIDSMHDKKQIAGVIAYFNRIGATSPIDFDITQDSKDATKYVAEIGQGGLGLPDRDYYLKDDDAKLKDARLKYQALIEDMLAKGGDKQAAANARDILAVETAIAKIQWTKVENRDPVKTYNRIELAKLVALTPGYDWKTYQRATGIDGRVTYLVANQPSYFNGLAKVIESTPLPVWKAYFKWQLLNRYAPYLAQADVDRRFVFYGTVLRGVPQNEVTWKRGVRLVEGGAGEILGKLYVEKYFPPENKARMEKLVANLMVAYRQSIDTLDWMSPDTKKEAQKKLSTFAPKIGYPNKWRDYSKLTVEKKDLVGNVRRATTFEYQRQLAKLGKPLDRTEWGMTPQTINAYYNPQLNEIVFPAAILQPPFFNATADDAVNYGGIGAVIGHEISHGFDDQGSQFDELGNLRDWWTKDDHQKFAVKTKALVAQYAAYSPLQGYFVNGELTLGENIADNSGLAIAYKAYRLSLGGKEAPVIDGLTGDQRFYLGWAQVWRGKSRDAQVIVQIKSDPHSPEQFRGNGTLKNQPGFYSAFGVKEGDKMYLKPEERVLIW
ncbi:MAG: M13 family peptidase [Herminiimonas sp.]|nr:M13 family peptidase [Herminiimonas sp.]